MGRLGIMGGMWRMGRTGRVERMEGCRLLMCFPRISFDTEVSGCDVVPESVPIHEAKLCVFVVIYFPCCVVF